MMNRSKATYRPPALCKLMLAVANAHAVPSQGLLLAYHLTLDCDEL